MATLSRPSREKLHMATALLWADRALCSSPDRKVGCVITSADMSRIISFGYNGPAKHLPNDYCARWKQTHPPSAIGNLSRCPCAHAEINAISRARESLDETVLFVTLSPCEPCAHVIANAGIAHVYYHKEYMTAGKPNLEAVALLRSIGIRVHMINPPGFISESNARPESCDLPNSSDLARGYLERLKQHLTSAVDEFLKEM